MIGIKIFVSLRNYRSIAPSYHYPYLQDMCRKHLYEYKADKANNHSEGEFL